MNLDITIQGEMFLTYNEYSLLASRIYIHKSLGGHVAIKDCVFNFSIIEKDIFFVKWFNDMVGFEMIKESYNILNKDTEHYINYWTRIMAKLCVKHVLI